MGEMYDEEKTHLGFTEFQAPDGVALLHLYETFGSPAEAKAYFDRVVGKAAKIVSRGDKKDRKGGVIGERAELRVFASNGTDKNAAVLWTDGRHFEEIISNSRCHVLELERRFTYGWRLPGGENPKRR